MNYEIGTLQDVVCIVHERGNTHADCEALICFQKEEVETWTWAQLSSAIGRFRGEFDARGLNASDRMMLGAPNSPLWIAACLAAIEAGAVIVPFDIQLDGDSLSKIFSDADASLVITNRASRDRIKALIPNMEIHFFLLDDQQACTASNCSPAARSVPTGAVKRADCGDTAAIFYTSGTTGWPKGVPLSHSNLAYQVNSLSKSNVTRDGDRVLLPLPFYHIYPFALGIMYPIAVGLPIILPYDLTGRQLLRALMEGRAS